MFRMDLREGVVFMPLKVDLNWVLSYCTLVHSLEGQLVQQTLISDSVLEAKEEKIPQPAKPLICSAKYKCESSKKYIFFKTLAPDLCSTISGSQVNTVSECVSSKEWYTGQLLELSINKLYIGSPKFVNGIQKIMLLLF